MADRPTRRPATFDRTERELFRVINTGHGASLPFFPVFWQTRWPAASAWTFTCGTAATRSTVQFREDIRIELTAGEHTCGPLHKIGLPIGNLLLRHAESLGHFGIATTDHHQ